ncbi:MAG: dipeptide epimerase [Myxococcales bacterium]|nr:dipeptide epimerase [Myxococcales bacterium]
MSHIVSITAEPMDIELTEPFGIAGGAQEVAANVLVQVTLGDGSVGLGEGAPFTVVSGETQGRTLERVRDAAQALLGSDARRFLDLANRIREACGDAPSARCALETAVLDAALRSAGLSMWHFFGGRVAELESDVTIVAGDVPSAVSAARAAVAAGFSMLKVKVGEGVELDRARLDAIKSVAPDARLVLDANGGFDAVEAIELVNAVGRERIALFEQPTPAQDLDGLRRVRAHVRVAADESARGAADVVRLGLEAAADVVNVKIMKTGIAEALDVIATARSFGLGLMVGGMVESSLAMTTSACLAAGQGGFEVVDLDTPLFLRNDPTRGGMLRHGARIRVDGIAAGHGVTR